MAKGLTLQELQAMGAKPAGGLTLDQLRQQSQPQPTTQNTGSLADSIWMSIASVAKNPTSPLSYAPAIAIGAKAIVNAPSDIADQAKSGMSQFLSGIRDTVYGFPDVTRAESALSAASGLATAVSSPIAPIAKPVAALLNDATNRVTDIPAVQNAALKLPELPYDRVAKVAGDIGNVAGTVAGGMQAAKIAVQLPAKASKFVTDLSATTEKQIESKILTKFEKGVKPGINVKMTPAKLENYREDVVTAVRTIKNNKSNLSYNDASGEVISGQTPKSLQQLADAVEQTKKTVFQTYDMLSKQAGDAGVAVDLKPIASELDAVIGNKALSLTNPKAVQYAQDIQQRLVTAGKLDAVTAQEVVQNYNKSLEAFYRNPTYDNASQAAIDAMLANKVRASLDDGITGLTGQQYGVLKQQYGALKAIEKDVIKASLRNARASTKGLIDFTDIFSGGQIVHGILSLNPATIAQGITAKTIAEFYKYLNNPNRAIEKMFNAADKLPK